MSAALAGPDSLKLSVGGVETRQLHAVGTVPGIRIILAAARNAPGTGRLRTDGDGRVAWKAPGSGAYGAAVAVSDGNFRLEDGEDRDKFVRVEAYAAHLADDVIEAKVLLADVFNNHIGHTDITSSQATAGDVETYQITLTNQSGLTLTRVRGWLDASVVDIEISTDGASWVAPDAENHVDVLVFDDLAPGATDILHVRRTIGAASDSDPDILNWFHFAFEGM